MIRSVLVLALIAGPAFAQTQRLTVMKFDDNGGSCAENEIGYTATFGAEGMVHIEHDSRYVASGSYAINSAYTSQGFSLFETTNEMNPQHKEVFIVTNDGYITNSINYLHNMDLISQEGMVDVIKMDPCQ